ncbi:MAG TPA: ribbon-helix-helix protein, CopG family [Chloroflexota bacterium]|nr:ribbon-helix-helix protein, CopG family [Chloroflexota bacterium]
MHGTLTQLTVPNDFLARFDELARATGQHREDVMLAALEAYLREIAEEDARIEAASQRGEIVDVEVVHADGEALIARLGGINPDERAKIRAQVRAEMEAAYGMTLCE